MISHACQLLCQAALFPAAQSRLAHAVHASCVALRLLYIKLTIASQFPRLQPKIPAKCDEREAWNHLRRCFRNILVIILLINPKVWQGTRVSSCIVRSWLRTITDAFSRECR
jgi:hypothetical protein